MGNFHRFVDPTYYLFGGESFPGSPGGTGSIGGNTYDRMNVTSGGVGGPGGAANVGVQKPSGPNQYTYFVAFGEHATSENTNRGLKALAENSDAFDDLFRKSIPKEAFVVVAGANQTGQVLTGDVFVGDAGAVAADLVAFLVSDVVGSVLEVGGVRVTITDIDNGTPGSSVLGSGFHTNPTVRFSAPLPAGDDYIFLYFTRTSTARIIEQDRQELVKRAVRSSAEIWNNNKQFVWGLNEMYRRATKKPAAWTVDTAGDGATIVRDGKAITVVPTPANWTTTPYTDPFLANYVGGLSGALSATSLNRNYSGDMGHVQLGTWRQVAVTDELTQQARPLSSYAALNVRVYPNSTTGGSSTYTRLVDNAPVMMNPSGVAPSTVVVEAPNWFRNASGRTAMILHYDLLIITRDSGVEETYVVTEILSNTSVRVVTPGGASPTFGADEEGSIRWAQPMFAAGGGMVGTTADDPGWGPLTVVMPTAPVNDVGQTWTRLPCPRIIGPENTKLWSLGKHEPFTGLITEAFSVDSSGVLTAAGRVHTEKYLSGSLLLSNNDQSASGNVTVAVEVDPLDTGAGTHAGKALIELLLQPGAGNTLTVNINLTSSDPGIDFYVLVVQDDDGVIDLNWDAGDFKFSGNDGEIPPESNGRSFLFHGIVSAVTGYALMTRTDY